MSAVGAQEAQLGRLDVLQFGGDRTVAGLDARRQGQVQELRGLRLKTGGREAWRAVIDMKENETPYRQESTQQFESRFGAGEAQYDSLGRKVSKEPVTPEKKAIYDEAKQRIEQTTKVMSYLELFSAKDQAQALATLQQSRPELQSLTVATLREQALDTIAADPAFQKLFPELKNPTGGDPARRLMIEDTLAKDPRFRARLEARMQGIYEQAQKLPEVKGSDSLKKAEAERLQNEAKIDKLADDTAKILLAKRLKITLPGTTTAVDATRDNIKQLLQGITDEGLARDKLTIALLGSVGCTEDDYVKHIKPLRITLPARQKLLLAEAAKHPGNLISQGNGPMQQEITALTKQLVALDVQRAANPHYQDVDRAYTQLTRELSDTGLATVGATSLWEVYTKGMVEAQSQAALLDSQINLLRTSAPSQESLQSERIRLIEETKLLNQLESVLGNSIVDVMENRYDQMVPLEEERLAAALKTAEEAKKTELAASIKRLGEKMGSKWLGYDKLNRRRAPHKDAIKEDMQRLMYATNQEEEIKRMLIEDASLPKLKDSTGSDVDWKYIDLTTGRFATGRHDAAGQPIFEKADLTVLNDLYTSQKDAYTQKLFKSYFATRGWADRSFLGQVSGDSHNLGLKDHEWVLLEQQFGDQVSEALMSDNQGRATIDKLKSEGVIAGFKLKWLLYLLLIGGGILIPGGAAVALGGLGAVSASTAIGGGLAGSVVGGAAGRGMAGAINSRIH